jgi:hypothetical protein
MKETHPDRAGKAADADSLVREGLRALREQMPSDESRRATLAQLGIVDQMAAPATAAPVATAGRSTLRWLLGGVLLGVLALVVRHWLG